MKRMMPALLAIVGLLLITCTVKFFFLSKKISYEPIQTNIWLPPRATVIYGWILPNFHLHSKIAPVEIVLADFKSGFPEGGVITYPEIYSSGRATGVVVWHSDRDLRLYFVNQPVQKPDYLPWYIGLRLEIEGEKVIAYPTHNGGLGAIWGLIFAGGSTLLVIALTILLNRLRRKPDVK